MHDIQSVLHPAGIEAVRISHLWWTMLVVCTVVWLAVATAALIAIRRGRRPALRAADEVLSRNVAIAALVSVVALIGLLFQSIVTGRSLEDVASESDLHIQVTGNQWWWDVQYENPTPGLWVTTANEMHIPVGKPVVIDLIAQDVIHSLWIPNLQGKIDLIPGRRNVMTIQADKPGIYRGQCAEYCGVQHAHMALLVIAEAPADFEKWLAGNRAPAQPPSTPEQLRGKDVVERGPCAMCHNISGTSAGGRTAPDLTHVATRGTIGAATLPNTRGNLAGWIMDPQHIKPGNRMPATGLSSDELQAVLAYLENLK